MEFIKNLFGGDGKNEFSERIPDILTPDQFGIYPTFHHGFLSHPSCLAYDSIQHILAIGSHQGNIVVIGKPALEKHFSQPNNAPVVQLLFIENQGQLVTRCADDTLYLWNIKEKMPFVECRLEFKKDKPSVMSLSYQSDWLYVGMEESDMHIVNVRTFQLSGYTIYWDKVTAHEAGHRTRPGAVIAIQEHPVDHSKILLAFNNGLCVLWNSKLKVAEKRFRLSKNKTLVLTSIDWNSSGKHFAAGYSDGSIALYNIKNEGKPEKFLHPHDSVASNSPIFKVQWVDIEGSEPVFVFSGGFPDSTSIGVKSLTFYNSRSTNLLNFEDSIIDFICLPSSPFVTDAQRLFAVVVLTDSELIVHDLQSQGYPSFRVPFSFDVNNSPVTTINYNGNCPDDFVAELLSALSKLPQPLKSTKRWPLSGGKWGQEIPDPWTDLVATGHANGTVRLWYCKSAIMQPLLTINLSKYLKNKSSSIASPPHTSPISSSSPPRTKPHVQRVSSESSLNIKVSTDDVHVPIPRVVTTPSIDVVTTPPNQEPSTPIANGSSHKLFALGGSEDDNHNTGSTGTTGSTGITSTGVTDTSSISTGATGTSTGATGTTGSAGKPKRKGTRLFGGRKKTKKLKPEDTDPHTTIQKPQTLSIVEESPPIVEETPPITEETKEEVKQARPTRISSTSIDGTMLAEKDDGTTHSSSSVASTPSATEVLNITTQRSYSTEGVTTPSSVDGYMVFSLTGTPETAAAGGRNSSQLSGYSVNYIRCEPESRTLCVSTDGGHVLCMDFSHTPVDDRPSQTLQVNFADDSIVKPDEEESVGVVSSRKTSSSYNYDYSFNNEIDKILPGFHVLQHCFCYYGRRGSTDQPSGVHITDMRFNAHKSLLTIGSDHGLAIISTSHNVCLKVLAHLESILYVADPEKYSRQCRKLVEDCFQGGGSSNSPSQQQLLQQRNKLKDSRRLTSQLSSPLMMTCCEQQLDLDTSGSKTLSDFESQLDDRMVTCVEIVQMFVNKSGAISLTVWVGTKSGKVGVYIINSPSKPQLKLDFLPTGIILDMKSYIVHMMFLSEWGERLINPYMSWDKDDMTNSSPALIAINNRRTSSSKSAAESEKPVNYAIITARDRIKSIGFPSNNVVAEAKPSLSSSSAVFIGSEFMTCKGLPCVTSWTTNGLILIHTLPGLKPMLQVTHDPLLFVNRSLYSFQVSCDGQALYQATPTQFQRLSLINKNQLNYPKSLPDVFVDKESPQPASKGIFQTLFKQGSVDRNDFFGLEAAGKAWKSVAKREEFAHPGEELSAGSKPTIRGSQHSKDRVTRGGGATGGTASVFQQTREKLDQRGKDLSKIEENAEELVNHGEEFANLAHLLAEKQRKKRFF